METRKVDDYVVYDSLRSQTIDFCQFCRNIDKCIACHWKSCRPSIDWKRVKLNQPLSYK